MCSTGVGAYPQRSRIVQKIAHIVDGKPFMCYNIPVISGRGGNGMSGRKAAFIIHASVGLCAVTALSVGIGRFAVSQGLAGSSSIAVFKQVFPCVLTLWLVLWAGGAVIRRMGRLTLKKLDMMDGHEFEYACAGLLRADGFRNVQVTKGSGDFGVDIIAEKKHVRYAVQCKRYDKKLNNSAIQEVIGGLAVYGCEVGAVMTNSYFTEPAKRLAEINGVVLWDRDSLEKLLDKRGSKKEVSESIAENAPLADSEEVCADTVEGFLASRGMQADIQNTDFLEDSCELLIEIKPQLGVRVDDIRSITDELAEYGGWEKVDCRFPSKTAGTVGLVIQLANDEE